MAPYLVLCITHGLSGVLLAIIAAYAFWRHKHRSKPAGVLAILGMVSIVAETISMLGGSSETARIFYHIRFAPVSALPVIWLIYCRYHFGRGRLSPLTTAGLFAIPAMTQAVIWTNTLSWLWLSRGLSFISHGPFLVPDYSTEGFGLWIWVQTAFSFLCLIAGTIIVIHAYRRQSISGLHALALCVSAFITFALFILPPVRPMPDCIIEPAYLSLSLSVGICAIIPQRRHLGLDAVISCNDILSAIDDPILVIDANGLIIDCNRAMENLIARGRTSHGRVSPHFIRGRHTDEIFSWSKEIADFCRDTNTSQAEVSLSLGGDERCYHIRFIRAPSPGGAFRLALFRDVTPWHRAQSEFTKKRFELDERIKELNCLYGISEIVRASDLSDEEIIFRSIALIPPAMRYPKTAFARAEFNGRELIVGESGAPAAILSVELTENGIRRGSIAVCYREIPAPFDKDPFHPRERALLETIGNLLSAAIERRTAENARRLSEMRLEALHDMEHMEFQSERELIEYALEQEVRLTGSEIGYFHFVGEDEDSIELFVWSKRALETCTLIPPAHHAIHAAGVWADCAKTRKPVIHNDYQSLPNKSGYPEGHSHLIRHMSVPMVHEGRVVAISGVANKSEPYNESDVLQMELFMHGVWKILARRRASEALMRAMEEKDDLLLKLEVNEFRLNERNKRMELDLMIAQAAQKAFVRREKPDCSFLEIDFSYIPMDKVGGDYFSFFEGDNRLSFFVCDVTGHGISAALFIALIRSITDRLSLQYPDDPAAILKNLNEELIHYISSHFVTCLYGTLERMPDDVVRLSYANGGHSLPILVRDCEARFLGRSEMILGVSGQVEFSRQEETLQPGDRLYVYTDGIPETSNRKREMIGFEQNLLELFRRSRSGHISVTLGEIIAAVNRFRDDQPQQDDITLIGIRVR